MHLFDDLEDFVLYLQNIIMVFYMLVFKIFLLYFIIFSSLSMAKMQDSYVDCFKVDRNGTGILINGDKIISKQDGTTGSVCREMLGELTALIEPDKVTTITIKGDDAFLGSLLIELAGVIPRLKKLKTINLDAYYPHDYLDNDIRDFSEIYKENHGLVINFVYDGSVILKQLKIK